MAVFGKDFGFPDYIDVNDIFDPLAEDIDNGFDSFREDEEEREDEARAFESIPKHGVHAHAFNKGLDNLKMKKLREEGLTYRAIAKQIGCSPSTVRNRLKKMGEK